MRPIRVLVVLLLVALVAGSLAAWPALPPRLPIHFGASGRPDAWADRSIWSWFLIPALAVVMTLVLVYMPLSPSRLNVPGKERLLALPPARQVQVLDAVRRAFDVLALVLVILFGTIQVAVWRAAHGASVETLVVATLVLGLVGSLGAVVVMLTTVQHRLDEQWRAHRREQPARP